MFRLYLLSRRRFALAASAALCAVLCSGLAASSSVQAQAPDPATQLYVKSMNIGWSNVGGTRRLPFAVVRIIDGNGVGVDGALVVGDWSGCFKETGGSDLTEDYSYVKADGTVYPDHGVAWITAQRAFSCWGMKQKCYFTFTVTGVSKVGMTYVPVPGQGTSWWQKQCN